MNDNMTGLITQVKPSDCALAVETMIRARVPVFLWGPPGVGKSAIMAQTADKLGMAFLDVRVALLDPVDLRGLPRVTKNQTEWVVPSFLPQASRDGETGILFLDELTAAAPAMQAASFQLILDRKLGDYTLSTGWRVAAAGNREGDMAVAYRMATALANRFAHVEVVPDLKDWCKWALAADLRAEIVAFLRFRPELLHLFTPRSPEKAFPSPRSWEMASRVLDADPPRAVQLACFAGIVGQMAAIELTGFLRVFADLPSVDAVLLNPDKAMVPTDLSALYAITSALAKRADENVVNQVYTYLKRLPPEFTVVGITDAIGRRPTLQQTKAFVAFSSEFADVVL
jgi:MoxR-like ATPase